MGAPAAASFYGVTTAGVETTLYTFTGGSDGYYPYGGLTYVKGKLYGTTSCGGARHDGTVFALAGF